MNSRNFPLLLIFGGLWLIVVFVALLTVVKVEHFELTGWIFTLLLFNTLVSLLSLSVACNKTHMEAEK